MLISPAFAQEAVASSQAVDSVRILFQFFVIFVVFYFFLIRPQQKKMKEHALMQNMIAPGDTIVTNGGLVGKVVKASERDLLVEIAAGVQVIVLRDRVLGKCEPPDVSVFAVANANDSVKKGSKGLEDLLTKK